MSANALLNSLTATITTPIPIPAKAMLNARALAAPVVNAWEIVLPKPFNLGPITSTASLYPSRVCCIPPPIAIMPSKFFSTLSKSSLLPPNKVNAPAADCIAPVIP